MSIRRGRRVRFNSPFASWRKSVLRAIARPFLWFRPTTRFICGSLLLTLVTAWLLDATLLPMYSEVYKQGEVVRSNVISPADIEVEDIDETQRRRIALINSMPSVWRYDPAQSDAAATKLRRLWEEVAQLQSSASPDTENVARTGATSSAPRAPSVPISAAIDQDFARALIAHRFDQSLLAQLLQIIRESAAGYIYADGDKEHLTTRIRLVDLHTSRQAELNTTEAEFRSVSSVRQNIRERLSTLPRWTPSERDALFSVMAPAIKPTIVFDQATTNATHTAAASTVSPVLTTLKRNRIVAREGDQLTPQMLAQLAAIRTYSETRRRPHHFIGLLIIVAALYAAAWRFTEYRSTITTLPISKTKAFTLVCSAIVVQLIWMRLGFIVAHSIAAQTYAPPLNDPTLWSFAIPFAAAALLLTLLVDTQLALIAAILTAIFAGLLSPNGMLMTCYAMISSSAAIYGIGRYRERQSVTVAGLFVGLANALMGMAVILSAQQPFTLNSALLAIACGLAGGLLTTIFTAGGLPVNESLFGILTDIKLLELSNADLPVLGQLALRAPGTNQHSHAVGQLAEDACRAIGANSLLARIGALYHDIGKSAAPEMFVENQTDHNPHDRLRPSNSARIITSHVTYGLKLAEEIGLPKQISDFIPQHHGTRTLHYFLRKAQAQAAEGEMVDETEFRYPGPKPQFKEAAIMMLADSCEAAARSLAKPDPENIRAIVTKIFDAIVSDGQLDECDLSLRELTRTREAIITSLTAIYHARIDYPGFNPPAPNPALPLFPEADLDTEERGLSDRRPCEMPINKGGEIEDEAIIRK